MSMRPSDVKLVRLVRNNNKESEKEWLVRYQEQKFARKSIEDFADTSMVQQNDDTVGKTLVSASTLQKDVKAELEKTNDVAAAAYLGTVIGKKAVEAGIKAVVFDRGGFIYQGKIQALADAAREAGLEF